ncbi:hypothetical protein HDV02_004025 [Globomyces sp. JEL0801]|nr:hypothetical protein HDV02_004025 [Globomyces sp. JEL0801]
MLDNSKGYKQERHDQSHQGLKDCRCLPKKGGAGQGGWGTPQDEIDAGCSFAPKVEPKSNIQIVGKAEFDQRH